MGADSHTKTSQGLTPLHYAAFGGQGSAVVHELISAGCAIDARSDEGLTPLHLAARRKHIDTVRALLAEGADPSARSTNGRTPLLEAARRGAADVVDILAESGADLDSASADGRTPLLAAAAEGHLLAVRKLLAAGADVMAKDEAGMTALHMAREGGHAEMVGFLSECGLHDDTSRLAETLQQLVGELKKRGSTSNARSLEDVCRTIEAQANLATTPRVLEHVIHLCYRIHSEKHEQEPELCMRALQLMTGIFPTASTPQAPDESDAFKELHDQLSHDVAELRRQSENSQIAAAMAECSLTAGLAEQQIAARKHARAISLLSSARRKTRRFLEDEVQWLEAGAEGYSDEVSADVQNTLKKVSEDLAKLRRNVEEQNGWVDDRAEDLLLLAKRSALAGESEAEELLKSTWRMAGVTSGSSPSADLHAALVRWEAAQVGCEYDEALLSQTYTEKTGKVHMQGLRLVVKLAFDVLECVGKADDIPEEFQVRVQHASAFLQSQIGKEDPPEDVSEQVRWSIGRLQKNRGRAKGSERLRQSALITELLLGLALGDCPSRYLRATDRAAAHTSLTDFDILVFAPVFCRLGERVDTLTLLGYLGTHIPETARSEFVVKLLRKLAETVDAGLTLQRGAMLDAILLAMDDGVGTDTLLEQADVPDLTAASEETLSDMRACARAARNALPTAETWHQQTPEWRLKHCFSALATVVGEQRSANVQLAMERAEHELFRWMSTSTDAPTRATGIDRLVRLEALKSASEADYAQVRKWEHELKEFGQEDLANYAQAVWAFTDGELVNPRTGREWKEGTRSVLVAIKAIEAYLSVHQDDEDALRLYARMHWHQHQRLYHGNPDFRARNKDGHHVFATMTQFLLAKAKANMGEDGMMGALREAAEWSDRAARSNPRDVGSMVRHAEVLLLAGRPEEAAQAAEGVLQARNSEGPFRLSVTKEDARRAQDVLDQTRN